MSHYDEQYERDNATALPDPQEVDLNDYCVICGEKKQDFINHVCSDCAAEYELSDKQETNPLRGE